MAKNTERNTAASTTVTKAMDRATNFSRSLRIIPEAPLVEKNVENVEICAKPRNQSEMISRQ